MKEMVLQHIWKSLHFKTDKLQTEDGKKVGVIYPGDHNLDQGPDFLNARITVDDVEWFGHVEIHVDSKEWYLHGHHKDPNYNSVVLHVVLEAGPDPILREDGTVIPEVSIKEGIEHSLLMNQKRLPSGSQTIPCGSLLEDVPDLYIGNWLDRMGVERIQNKVQDAASRLGETVQDWEQVLWEELAATLGGRVNRHAFRELAQEVPVRIMRKYAKSELKLEALLYGASGLLKESPKGRNTPST